MAIAREATVSAGSVFGFGGWLRCILVVWILASPTVAQEVDLLICGAVDGVRIDTNQTGMPDEHDAFISAVADVGQEQPLDGSVVITAHAGDGEPFRGLTNSTFSFHAVFDADNRDHFDLEMTGSTGVLPPVKPINYVRVMGSREDPLTDVYRVSVQQHDNITSAIPCQEATPAVALSLHDIPILFDLDLVACDRHACTEATAANQTTHIRLPDLPLLPDGCSISLTTVWSECAPHFRDAYIPVCDGGVSLALADDPGDALLRIAMDSLPACPEVELEAARPVGEWMLITAMLAFLAVGVWVIGRRVSVGSLPRP